MAQSCVIAIFVYSYAISFIHMLFHLFICLCFMFISSESYLFRYKFLPLFRKAR